MIKHILLIAALATVNLNAETLAQLTARLVSDGIVQSTGTAVSTGDTVAVTDATGARALTEMRLPVTITTDAAGSQRKTSVLVLVYDLGQGDESAHLVDSGARNYVAPAASKASMIAGWILGKQALGYTVSYVSAQDLGVTTGIVVNLTAQDGTVSKRAVAVIEGAILELAAE